MAPRDDDDGFELFGKWFWISAGILAVVCAGLVVAYYVRHPERDLFADFARRAPVDAPSTNGHVPSAPAPVGADADGGETAG